MKRGKKYLEAAKAIDRATLYDSAEAVALVKKSATAKFDETIEAHIRTGCDGRHADQQIRGAVVLPHGTGKKVRVHIYHIYITYKSCKKSFRCIYHISKSQQFVFLTIKTSLSKRAQTKRYKYSMSYFKILGRQIL